MEQDYIRAVELKEIQEDEKYIQMLATQREKLVKFKDQFFEQEKVIKELRKEAKNLEETKFLAKQHQEEIEKLTEDTRMKDFEIEELRSAMKQQINDYNNSLKELQILANNERQENDRKIRDLNEKHEAAKSAQNEVSELKTQILELNTQLEGKTRRHQEANEQVNSWKSLEKVLKTQASELSAEKTELGKKLQKLQENSSKLEDSLKQEKLTIENLTRLLSDREKELTLLTEKSQNNQ